MESNHESKESCISMRRTFWRTTALMLLFMVALYNFKLFIQYFSSFSIASVMTHVRVEDLLSTGLLIDLAQFFTLVIAIHIIWILVISYSCKPWFKIFESEAVKTQIWMVIVLLHFTAILAANAFYYPTSLLGFLRETPIATPVGLVIIFSILTAQLIWAIWSDYGNKVVAMTTITIAICICLLTLDLKPKYAPDNEQPNIFIIGLDGLRPDHLRYTNNGNNFAPHLDNFIAKSQVYTNTYTPLGRTYVAWMSVLTGQYPRNHGARFNLAPPELVKKEIPLVRELKARNYKTIYAMDERRFNQIDSDYGFDDIVGPKVGAADAIISGLADFPLINLISNLPGISALLPYLYINRGYGKAYSPQLFNNEVLNKLSSKRANFLSIHFCQLHWPYTSKDFIDTSKAKWEGNYNHFMYQALLEKIDKQVNNFLQELELRGYLNNAIVYLISDHGESFMLEKDKIFNISSDKKIELNTDAWGHGTNVLSQEQSLVLMAYRKFSPASQALPGNIIEGTFSLTDIAPSLFQELDMTLEKFDRPFDGITLDRASTGFQSRAVFVESSIPVNAINASFIDEKKVLSETASNYEIRTNGRAVLKPEVYKNMIAKKQRSVYQDQWQMAYIPDYEEIILIDTVSNHWQNLSTYKGDAPIEKMLENLCNHYNGDLGFDINAVCVNNSLISNKTLSRPN